MPTPIGTAAKKLWKTGEAQDYQEALAHYETVIAHMHTSKNNLKSLDTYWRTTLPALLHKQSSPFLTKDQFVRIMQWKLNRGKMRPLLHLIQGNDEGTLQRLSKEALGIAATAKTSTDIKKAIEILSRPEIKGVGPATASAVLAAYRPEVFPFMSDEATMIVLSEGGQKLKYSLAEYVAFQSAVEAKCKVLNKKEGKGGQGVTPEDVGRALWCLSKMETLGIAQQQQDKKKKRPAEAEEEEEEEGEEEDQKPKAKKSNGKTKK